MNRRAANASFLETLHIPATTAIAFAWLMAIEGLACVPAHASDQTADAVAKVEAKSDPAADIARLEASVPPPRPADVASVEALVAATYDSISGPAGKRDWNRVRSLMLPAARLTYSIVDDKGRHEMTAWSVAEFINATDQVFTTSPFFEASLVNRIERFGNIAQVFTSYASRSAQGAAPFQRGINSMQLAFDGKRWWIVSILWDIERPGNPLPQAMQAAPGK